MTKIACLIFFVAGCVAPMFATSNVVYVNYGGSDLNACTRTAPCKTITHALTAVTAGGIVEILNSGSYDRFTVTAAVTVKADPGVVANIDVPVSGTGVTVNAGSSDEVTLLGLRLHGNGGTGVGFQINSVGRITVENCISRNFAYGLSFLPSTASDLKIEGGTFEGSNTALYIVAANAHAAISHTTVYLGGINAAASVVAVTDSLITAGPGSSPVNGITVNSGTAVLENDVISEFLDGAGVEVFATAYISGCTITENLAGVAVESGTGFTRQNNTIIANNFNVLGTLTPFSGH
jgi:hypothetical protein